MAELLSSHCYQNMDVADQLLNETISWVKIRKEYGNKMYELATELEKDKKSCNVAKVVGSSVSVGGAAAMTASGVIAVCTGGAAIPFIFTAGVIGSALGIATNVTSDVVDTALSKITMKEATEIGEKNENLEKRIQKLMETLKEERDKLSPEDYVTERILRSMAKREGLIINDSVRLSKLSSNLAQNLGSETGPHVAPFIVSLVSILAMIGVRKSGKTLVSKGLPELAATMGAKAAGKAVGRVGAGAVGLAFSVPELIINCKNLDDCGTEVSSLRQNAKDVLAASEQLQGELDEIQKLFQKLSKVKSCIEKKKRSRDDKQTLLEFEKKNCRDEAVRQWLIENEEMFLKLVDMFQFLKAKIDEEEQNNHSNTVDITFVAHGAITDTMIPASSLLPLPTLSDVVLYSPWNCYLTATAAYGVATGIIEPQHREFYCSEENGCQVPDKKHEPEKLPDEWNSMRKAKDQHQKIPNIFLSPLRVPEDGAWDRFEQLENEHGKAGRNRIVIPFILPEENKEHAPFICPEEGIPFPVVTLALSLVLMFSRFQATLHLTACLGKSSEEIQLDEDALKQQYACTIDNTLMTSSLEIPDCEEELWKALKTMFG